MHSVLLHIVTGKGGTGKTTLSCVLGLGYAEYGKRTLVVSIDFAQNIDDVLNVKLGEEPKKIVDNLYAVRIDIDREVCRYIDYVCDKLSTVFPQWSVYNVDKYLTILKNMPGIEEHVIINKLTQLIENLQNFDVIVIDTPPTGVAARLITLPETMTRWLERLIQFRMDIVKLRASLRREPSEDPILNILKEDFCRFSKVSSLIKSHSKITIVTTLEKLPILEAARIVKMLREFNLNVHSIVFNKCAEDMHIEDFVKIILQDVNYHNIRIIKVPKLEYEPQGLDKLRTMLNYVNDIITS